MDKLFKLKEHGTDVRTEVLAGLTTFFAMSYILFVNPAMLSQTGMPAHWFRCWNAHDGLLCQPPLRTGARYGAQCLLYFHGCL